MSFFQNIKKLLKIGNKVDSNQDLFKDPIISAQQAETHKDSQAETHKDSQTETHKESQAKLNKESHAELSNDSTYTESEPEKDLEQGLDHFSKFSEQKIKQVLTQNQTHHSNHNQIIINPENLHQKSNNSEFKDELEMPESKDKSEKPKALGIFAKIFSFFTKNKFSEFDLESMEEMLLASDIGPKTTSRIIELLKSSGIKEDLTDKKYQKDAKTSTNVDTSFKNQIKDILVSRLKILESKIILSDTFSIITMSGVNGAGKTTTIAKLCSNFSEIYPNKKILVACCDTYRAAAYEQLRKVIIQATKASFFEYSNKSTPDGVAYMAIEYARRQKFDIVILDTSGRLQNNVNLMEEFAKFDKVITKLCPEAKKEMILVIDGNTGRNVINQIEIFSKSAKISGLILTKLDGLAKGGILIQIAEEFSIPVYFLGVGEGKKDFISFDANQFVDKLLKD